MDSEKGHQVNINININIQQNNQSNAASAKGIKNNVQTADLKSDVEEDKDEVYPIEYELTGNDRYKTRPNKIRTSPQKTLNSEILLNRIGSQMQTNPTSNGVFDFHPTTYSNQYKSQDTKVSSAH